MAITIGVRGAKFGQCNICGDSAKLTEDHTPPKGCFKPSKVQIHHITNLIAADPQISKPLHSQNGIKYRTLCGRCNNSLLGSKYDPPFISFVNSVSDTLNNHLYLPVTIHVRSQPQALIRALLGHISAQGVNRFLKGPHTEGIREYFLNQESPLPKGFSIYYWAFPYQRYVLTRDAAYSNLQTHTTFAFWLLKFFPIAFFIILDQQVELPFPVQRLDQWGDRPFEFEVDLPVTLRFLPPQEWPETPTGFSAILYGKEAIHATG